MMHLRHGGRSRPWEIAVTTTAGSKSYLPRAKHQSANTTLSIDIPTFEITV